MHQVQYVCIRNALHIVSAECILTRCKVIDLCNIQQGNRYSYADKAEHKEVGNLDFIQQENSKKPFIRICELTNSMVYTLRTFNAALARGLQ